MLSSDITGKIKSYNNKIVISLPSFKIGTNLKINLDDDKPDIKSLQFCSFLSCTSFFLYFFLPVFLEFLDFDNSFSIVTDFVDIFSTNGFKISFSPFSVADFDCFFSPFSFSDFGSFPADYSLTL